MKRTRIIVGVVAALLIAGALIFYFTSVPGMLAEDYHDAARPEHEKAKTALGRVYRTFSPKRFGVDTREVDRAKTPAAYVRALHRSVARERRELRPARAAVKRGRRALAALDPDALYEPPTAPLIGGSEEAQEIAERERSYIKRGRSFLRRYDELVDYQLIVLDFSDDAGTVAGNGFAGLPKNPGSPEAFAGPVDDIAARLDRVVRKFKRQTTPPRAERNAHRKNIAVWSFIADELREFADAVRARDLAQIEAFDDELTKGLKRYELGRGSLRRLLTRSGYASTIRTLRRRAVAIDELFDRL